MKFRQWIDHATPEQKSKLVQELSYLNDGAYDEFIDTVSNLIKVQKQSS